MQVNTCGRQWVEDEKWRVFETDRNIKKERTNMNKKKSRKKKHRLISLPVYTCMSPM